MGRGKVDGEKERYAMKMLVQNCSVEIQASTTGNRELSLQLNAELESPLHYSETCIIIHSTLK